MTEVLSIKFANPTGLCDPPIGEPNHAFGRRKGSTRTKRSNPWNPWNPPALLGFPHTVWRSESLTPRTHHPCHVFWASNPQTCISIAELRPNWQPLHTRASRIASGPTFGAWRGPPPAPDEDPSTESPAALQRPAPGLRWPPGDAERSAP